MGKKGERTAARILDVAEALFAERGFHATTLREIAAEVPLRPPSLYNHFDTKEAVYDAVLERALAPLLRKIAASDDVSLRTLPSAMLEALSAHPAAAKLWYRELLSNAPATRNSREWLRRLVRDALKLPAGLGSKSEEFALLLLMSNIIVGYFAIGEGMMRQSDLTLDPAALQRSYVDLLQRLTDSLVDATEQPPVALGRTAG